MLIFFFLRWAKKSQEMDNCIGISLPFNVIMRNHHTCFQKYIFWDKWMQNNDGLTNAFRQELTADAVVAVVLWDHPVIMVLCLSHRQTVATFFITVIYILMFKKTPKRFVCKLSCDGVFVLFVLLISMNFSDASQILTCTSWIFGLHGSRLFATAVLVKLNSLVGKQIATFWHLAAWWWWSLELWCGTEFSFPLLVLSCVKLRPRRDTIKQKSTQCYSRQQSLDFPPLFLSSSDSLHILSACLGNKEFVLLSAVSFRHISSRQPGFSRAGVAEREPRLQLLSLWAAEVVWLLIAVCQRDLGSQSKWPISKDEPKLIC